MAETADLPTFGAAWPRVNTDAGAAVAPATLRYLKLCRPHCNSSATSYLYAWTGRR